MCPAARSAGRQGTVAGWLEAGLRPGAGVLEGWAELREGSGRGHGAACLQNVMRPLGWGLAEEGPPLSQPGPQAGQISAFGQRPGQGSPRALPAQPLGRRPRLLLAWRTGRLTHSGLAEGQVLAEATCPHARPLRRALTLRPCPLRGTSRTDSHLQCGLFLGPSAPRPRYCPLGNGNRGSCCRPRATCTAQAQGTRQGQEPRWPQKHAGQAAASGLGRGGRPGPAPQCSCCGSCLSLLAWRAARWGPRRPR